MPGWDGFPVADTLSAEFDCPVLCENDVNLRALGEARVLAPDQSPLLYIKVSSGIGGGLVTATGKLYQEDDRTPFTLRRSLVRSQYRPPSSAAGSDLGTGRF
jgi:hypothetical protein